MRKHQQLSPFKKKNASLHSGVKFLHAPNYNSPTGHKQCKFTGGKWETNSFPHVVIMWIAETLFDVNWFVCCISHKYSTTLQIWRHISTSEI